MPSDLRTEAIVLRRTNYGESDRILNFITPTGKISALAHGARKEKSRLAGGIELFTVSEIVAHRGRSNLDTLTSAKMLKFYGNIITSLDRIEAASGFLKLIERASEHTDNPEHYSILRQALAGLDRGLSIELVDIWFKFNYQKSLGEDINLVRDASGNALDPALCYFWDSTEYALSPHPSGPISAREIKLARLILSSTLATIASVSDVKSAISPLESITGSFSY